MKHYDHLAWMYNYSFIKLRTANVIAQLLNLRCDECLICNYIFHQCKKILLFLDNFDK